MYDSLLARLPEGPLRRRLAAFGPVWPGFLASATVAMAATFLSDHYAAPVMLFALLLGIAFNFLSKDGACQAGIDFTSKAVLRFGVGLLGARITIEEATKLGPVALAVAAVGVPATIVFGVAAARLLGFRRDFGLLTGGAVGICGASAALALASVLPKREDGITERDVIFTVIGVTALSTIAMVLYPILTHALGLSELDAGVFLGATIHDVAQVVGAGYSISGEAGDAATLTKLLRVAMLVPVVLVVTVLIARGPSSGPRPSFPFFLIAFVALVALNSLGLIPAILSDALSHISRWALVAAIAALGMKTALGELASVGVKAMSLLALETLFIALVGLMLVALL